ncbi:MAG: hypothetical protein ACO1N9_12535 [Flavobacterium sp.]
MKFFYAITIFTLLCGCTRKDVNVAAALKMAMMPAKKLSVEGDFLGNGYNYILTAAVTNKSGLDVANVPDPYKTEWDSVLNYYNKHRLQVRVTINMIKGIDELIFDNAMGLYCLINVGDLNGDKRDEIALVPDRLDYSRHNYCAIYSLCDSGWKQLFEFSVHEDAFDYIGENQPILHNIPGALENRGDKWWYYDYLEMEYESEEEVGKMKPLVIPPSH